MIKETRPAPAAALRIIVPFLVAIALVVGTVIISGSNLIQIEDITINRVLAGTYGEPDWRVQTVNPLLSQVLTLLYRLLPMVNWYGVFLLGLLALSAGAAMGLAGRKRGGLLPGILLLSPIILLLTNALHATSICALSGASGAFLLMGGLQDGKRNRFAVIAGGVLFALGAMLSLYWAVLLAVAAILCFLPALMDQRRVRGLFLGVFAMAVIALALFGYESLMYNTAEMAAYRKDYAQYERILHSSLKEEADDLMSTYGISIYSEGHEDHDHEEGDDHSEEEYAIPENSFTEVGWSLNTSSLFFSRNATDSSLTDPQTLKALGQEAETVNLRLGRLLSELFTTLKKPQFLLLIALMILLALMTVITSRRKGLVAMLSVLFAFGGHIATIACYYSAFANIAPFYLLAIIVLLYHFDGEDALAFLQKVLKTRLLRLGAGAFVILGFAACMTGLLWYTKTTPANANPYTLEAAAFLVPYIEAHPEMLFIGDNPHERVKPNALAVPKRGADQNLLAGSYDLYSPRAAALMHKFGLENPMLDAMGREDVAYITMSFLEAVSLHLGDAHGVFIRELDEVCTEGFYAEKIIRMIPFTQEELEEAIAQAEYEREQEALLVEALLAMEAEEAAREAEEAAAGEAPGPSEEEALADTDTDTEEVLTPDDEAQADETNG